jgi:hypothetical protein
LKLTNELLALCRSPQSLDAQKFAAAPVTTLPIAKPSRK